MEEKSEYHKAADTYVKAYRKMKKDAKGNWAERHWILWGIIMAILPMILEHWRDIQEKMTTLLKWLNQ